MNNKITVQVKGGKLIATPSSDPNYPGIDIEFIADDDKGYDISRPRVLVEQPYDEKYGNEPSPIRALIWNNHHREDYSKEIELWHPDGENLRVIDDLSDNTMIGIQDDNDRLYEYHTDDDEVVVFSRYDEDPGEIISGPIAEKIRKFGLMQMEQNPNRWEKPSSLVYKNHIPNKEAKTHEERIPTMENNNEILITNHKEENSNEAKITPKDALEVLKLAKTNYFGIIASAFDIAISATEKEISQAPDFEGDGYDDSGNLIYDTWICPNCGHKYEVEYEEYERCPKCGQSIDEKAFRY